MFESVEEYNIPYIPPIMLNAYILYFTNTPNNPKMSRLSFDQSVIERLAAEHMVTINNEIVQRRVMLLQGKKERDCVVCSNRKQNIRRRSRTACTRCSKRTTYWLPAQA